MKKIKLISGLLLSAMAFASCSEDFTDWASPQSNPQESAISLPGYQAEPVSAIDLSAVEGDSVQIMTLTQAALPEGSVIDYTRIELLPVEGEETTPVTLNVDNEGRVGKADLQATLEGFYGKSPVQRILAGHVYSDIVINSQAFFVDASTINVVATPEAPLVASAYYLVGDFGGASWDIANLSYALYPLSETTQSYTTLWTGSGSFKFFTEANNWDSAFGAEKGSVAGAMSGDLASNVSNGADNISAPEVGAYYTFTVDIVNMNFTWIKLSDQDPNRYPTMNLSGDFNGWSIGGDGEMRESTPHNWYVNITIASDGALKFRSADDWNAGNWGGNGSVNIGDTYYGTAKFGGDNINVPAGTYDVYFNDITGQFLFLAE